MGLHLLDGIAEPAIALAEDGRILGANPEALEFLGAPAGEVIDRYCGDVIRATGADGARVCHPSNCPTLASLRQGRATPSGWCGWVDATGTTVPISSSLISIPLAERSDGVAAIIILHEPPTAVSERTGAARRTLEGLRVHLLGVPFATCDGVPVRVPRKRALELVALLALAGDDGLHRDRICDLLWPSAPPGKGRGHLRVLMHTVRQALGDQLVITHPADDRLRLSPDAWVDLRQFERGATRVLNRDGSEDAARLCREIDRLTDLYRGDLGEATTFGAWVLPVRERLRALHIALLARAVPLAPLAGSPASALEYCQRALAAEPLLEEFQVALIQLLARLGRHAEAARQYELYRRLLAVEAGCCPSPAFDRAVQPALGRGKAMAG